MKKLAALVTVGVLALAGCASGSPQAAAYVGDTQISLAQVDSAAKALAEVSSDTADTAAAFRPTVVQILIQNEVAKRTAAAANITVTDAQRQQVIAANASLASLMKMPALAAFISDYINTNVILSTDAGKDAAKKQIDALSITLNPRFGTWDPKQVAIVEGSTGSLSDAAPIKQE